VLRERHGAVDEFNFDGATCSLADVLDELRSYGLMSQHKVVVVDNAEQFMQGDDRRRAMERYAESPMQDATLILRSGGWRPGTFDKLVAAVRDTPGDLHAQIMANAPGLRCHNGLCGRLRLWFG
jgi:DNA polymerase III delta subunit